MALGAASAPSLQWIGNHVPHSPRQLVDLVDVVGLRRPVPVEGWAW